jgi:autotransporter passenger strand-loop-strand repeat protein
MMRVSRISETVAGTDVGATISAGGLQSIVFGGVATSTLVWSSGTETVSSGGTALSATLDGGTQNVAGLANAISINTSGSQSILSGGTASGTLVDGGGFETVSSGGKRRRRHAGAGTQHTSAHLAGAEQAASCNRRYVSIEGIFYRFSAPRCDPIRLFLGAA